MLEVSTSPGTREGGDPGADVDSDPLDARLRELDLTGVQAGPYVDTERDQAPAESALAQRTARAGPSNVDRVPSPSMRIDPSAMTFELGTDDTMMLGKEARPAPVAELSRTLASSRRCR